MKAYVVVESTFYLPPRPLRPLREVFVFVGFASAPLTKS